MPDYSKVTNEDLLKMKAARDFSAMSDDDLLKMYYEKTGKSPFDKAEVVQEQHPQLKGRFTAKNLGRNIDERLAYLKTENPGLQFGVKGGQIIAKTPEEKKWKVLDPEGFDIRDLTDVVSDVAEGVGVGVGTAAGGVLGGLPGAVAGGAVSGGVGDISRQLIAKLAGVRKEDFSGGEALGSAAIGAISPLLFGSGASAGQVLKQAVKPAVQKKLLGEAAKDLSAEELKKKTFEVLSQQQSGVMRLAPKVGELLSGSPSHILKDAPKYLPELQELEKAGNLVPYVKKVGDDVIGAVNARKNELQGQIGEALAKGGKTSFDVTPYINEINLAIKEAENRGLSGKVRATTGKMVEELQAMKDELFKYTDKTDVSQVNPAELMDIVQDLKGYSQGFKIPGGIKDGTSRLDIATTRLAAQLAERVGKDLDDALKTYGAEGVRNQYARLKEMQNDLFPKFKDIDTTSRWLSVANTKAKQTFFDRLGKYDKELGTNIQDKVKLMEQYRFWHDPSMSQISRGGSTSTSVTKRAETIGRGVGGLIGANVAGPAGAVAGGYAGGLAMTALNSPAAYRKYINAWQGMKGGINQVADKLPDKVRKAARVTRQAAPVSVWGLFTN